MRSKSDSPYDAIKTPVEIATTIPKSLREGSFSFIANEMRSTETGVKAFYQSQLLLGTTRKGEGVP